MVAAARLDPGRAGGWRERQMRAVTLIAEAESHVARR